MKYLLGSNLFEIVSIPKKSLPSLNLDFLLIIAFLSFQMKFTEAKKIFTRTEFLAPEMEILKEGWVLEVRKTRSLELHSLHR